MIHVAVRVRELVSSNVDALVSKAGDHRKMMRLLQSEIEESLITLHGDLSRTQRAHDRQAKGIEALASRAEEWTAKAKVAIDHGREDLARSALLAREGDRQRVSEAEAEAQAQVEKIAELEEAISELEAKREDMQGRIAALDSEAAASTTSASDTAKDSTVARRMDRIDALERRASFEDAAASQSADPASIEAEIAELEKASAIEAELAALKSAGTKKPAPKKRTAKKA